MEIVFRTDASLEIGTGHVMRCLTLADELARRGATCRFVCREHPGHLIEQIRRRGYEAYSLPVTEGTPGKTDGAGDPALAHAAWLGADWAVDAQQTLSALHGMTPDWLVIDHYAIDSRWEMNLRHACRRLMVIDDLADRAHDCEVLLDQNWFGDQTDARYNQLVPDYCRKLLGPQHALLNPEYERTRKTMQPRDGIVRRILVFIGGSDPENQTAKVIEALNLPDLICLAVDVVIGINHPDPIGIQCLVSERPATMLFQGLPSLVRLMEEADLMIGAGGATNWERMCMGLPCIVMSIADNQTPTNVALMKSGHINFLGRMGAVTSRDIANAVCYCLANPEIMKSQSASMQRLVSGTGVSSLATLLHSYQ